MPKFSIQEFADQLSKARAGRGVREVAREIGISHATLSRVENGNQPDLDTFQKICAWLKVDPNEFLGKRPRGQQNPEVRVHFKKDRTLSPGTSKALAELIELAHKEMMDSERI